jgi:hypothetical protein
LTKILEAVAVASLLAMFGFVGFGWSGLPPIIPTHYGVSGEPDQWGARAFVWVLPAVGLGLYAMLTTVSSLVGAGKVPVNARGIVAIAAEDLRREVVHLLTSIKAFLIAAFAYIVWEQIYGDERGLGPFFLPMIVMGPLAMIGWTVLRIRRIFQ